MACTEFGNEKENSELDEMTLQTANQEHILIILLHLTTAFTSPRSSVETLPFEGHSGGRASFQSWNLTDPAAIRGQTQSLGFFFSVMPMCKRFQVLVFIELLQQKESLFHKRTSPLTVLNIYSLVFFLICCI